MTISALSQSLYTLSENSTQPENVLLIIKPLSTLEVVRELPTGEQYKQQIMKLIQTVTQLHSSEFQINEDINPVTNEPDQQHILVKLPSKAHVDKLYNAQPYFGCLVAHKLSHMQICPFIRYHPDLCLTCSSKKVTIFSFLYFIILKKNFLSTVKVILFLLSVSK